MALPPIVYEIHPAIQYLQHSLEDMRNRVKRVQKDLHYGDHYYNRENLLYRDKRLYDSNNEHQDFLLRYHVIKNMVGFDKKNGF